MDLHEHDEELDAGGSLRTFLIADVRGYTRFTQARGDEAAAELAATFAGLTRDVVTSAGGELVELRGDEALAVFTSPRQAVRTAVALQRRLRGAADPAEALPLGVGVGLDAGEAVAVEGGYRGKALNVAARLCSLAAPGEILATETVTALAGAVPGLRMTPRKPVRVKGIDQPVRLVSVSPEDGLPPLQPLEAAAAAGRRRLAFLAAGLATALLVGAAALFFLDEEGGATRLAANSLGRVDRDGDVQSVLPVGAHPSDVVLEDSASREGEERALWVSNELDSSVWRIDPQTQAVRQLPLSFRPTALAFGDGALWVLDPVGRRVVRVDAATEREVEDYEVGNGASDVAFGGQAVWVTNAADGSVTKIDVENERRTTLPAGIEPSAAAYGEGALWVANAGSDNVMRIDTSTNELSSIPVGHEPRAVAVGEDAVWVASTADGTVWELDPARLSARRTVPVSERPSDLAADGPDVWVTSESAGTLARVTGGGQVETHDVGGGPTAIVVDEDDLWLAAVAPRAAHLGGTLVIAGPLLQTDPTQPSPGANVSPALHDGLVGFKATGGPGGLTLVPDLATDLPKPTRGGRRYAFSVRRGIRYSNGEEVKASHFRSSLERAARLGAYVPLVESLRGAGTCLERRKACDLSGSIRVDDDEMTVTFLLAAPDPDFLYKAAFPTSWVVPPDTPERILTTEPVPTTGPYAYGRIGRREMVFVRNEHFEEWSADAQPEGFVERIVIRDQEGTDPVTAILGGKADAAVEPIPEDRARSLAIRHPDLVHAAPGLRIHMAAMNTREPPFDDARVRRAVNLAVDRKRLVDRLGGPQFARPTCQLITPNVLGYQPHCKWTRSPGAGIWRAPDLTRARALVRASGTTGDLVEVLTPPFEPMRTMARGIEEALETLGYRVRTRVVPGVVFDYYDELVRPAFQIGPASWAPDLPVPGGTIVPILGCRPPEELTWTRFCSRELDEAAQRAAELQATNPKAAADAWAEVDRRFTEQAPVAPLAVPTRLELVSRRVDNFQAHPLWGVLYSQLWVR